jgi:hypothetical protein
MDRLQYWYGEDYELIPNKLYIKHPKLLDILKIGQDKYAAYVSVLTLSPLHVADILYDNFKIWYKDITSWTLFINNLIAEMQNKDTDQIMSEALEFFTGLKFNPMMDANDNLMLINSDKNVVINEITFNAMCQFIKDINFMEDAEIYYQLQNAGSKGTAKYIMRQIASKRKIKNKNDVDLQSICSSLLWKTGVGEELFNYPIYRIYEGYARLNALDNWDKTVTAYYAGTIDTEKTKINFEKINWSKILK